MSNGIQVDGAFFNEDNTDLAWEDFIKKIESVGLQYGGKTVPIDDEGNIICCGTFRSNCVTKDTKHDIRRA